MNTIILMQCCTFQVHCSQARDPSPATWQPDKVSSHREGWARTLAKFNGVEILSAESGAKGAGRAERRREKITSGLWERGLHLS